MTKSIPTSLVEAERQPTKYNNNNNVFDEEVYTNHCERLFMTLRQTMQDATTTKTTDTTDNTTTTTSSTIVQRPMIKRFVEKEQRGTVENQWLHLPFHCRNQLFAFKDWTQRVFRVRFEYQQMYRLDQPYYIYFQKDKSKLSLYSYF